MHRVRILHISDLHERGSRESEAWRRRRVLGEPWENNLTELIQDGSFDLVLFTGDAADWGLKEEYDAAAVFLHALCERLHVSLERLFVIPGNHDVERSRHQDVWKRMRMAIRSGADVQALSRWMAGKTGPPLGFENAWRDQILERQTEYRAWVRDKLGRPELAVPLGYRVSLNLPLIPFAIHVLGMNTAWLCGDDADPKNLFLTDNQLMDAATENGRPLTGLRLLLMHHPFDELADRAECRRLAADHADLLFRGHLHLPEVDSWADPDRGLRQLAAGCLYEGHSADRYPNSCQTATLTLDDQGRIAQADLRFRSWSARGHWFDDDSLYRGSRQGRLTWHFETPPARSAVPNPYDFWNPRPETFVGRKDLLRRLEAALTENRSFSIVGDWRIGKSILLEVWRRRAQVFGRPTVALSGEGPEGKSVASFVQKITGLAAPDDADAAADLLSMWADGAAQKGGPPVILVDETDSIVRAFGPRFFERLRGMLGRVVLVFASRRDMDLLFQEIGTGSPLANRLELAWLGLLEDAAAEELIARGPSTHGDLMRHWAGRHPFFLQLLGYCVVEAERNRDSVESALDRFRMQASARIREWLRILSAREQADLRRALTGEAVDRRSLRERGLLTEAGHPFGEVLAQYMREEL